jgi:hypothetical protein
MKTRQALIRKENKMNKTMAGNVKGAEQVKNFSLSLKDPFSSEENLQWGKSLSEMPTFTIKEIEIHRKECGKSHGLKPWIAGKHSRNFRNYYLGLEIKRAL